MSGLRFSIANALAAMAFVCVGLAALRSDSGLVAGLMTLGTLGLITTAAVGSLYGRDQSRAFWLGVLVFGGAFFVVTNSALFAPAKAEIIAPMQIFYREYWSATIPNWVNAFGATSQAIVNVAFAWLGGLIARCFFVWRETRP
jgi:hypothetical protein